MVCVNQKVTGVIELQDIIKPGIKERFERLRRMGVKTVMAVSYTHLDVYKRQDTSRLEDTSRQRGVRYLAKMSKILLMNR